jgi:hypothetical protein
MRKVREEDANRADARLADLEARVLAATTAATPSNGRPQRAAAPARRSPRATRA